MNTNRTARCAAAILFFKTFSQSPDAFKCPTARAINEFSVMHAVEGIPTRETIYSYEVKSQEEFTSKVIDAGMIGGMFASEQYADECQIYLSWDASMLVIRGFIGENRKIVVRAWSTSAKAEEVKAWLKKSFELSQ